MHASLELHIQKLNEDLSLKDDKNFRLQLEHLINQLIDNDFSQLVLILYRVDVSETKLKDLLSNNAGRDAAIIITDLIIERQVQKTKARKQNFSDKVIPDEEIW